MAEPMAETDAAAPGDDQLVFDDGQEGGLADGQGVELPPTSPWKRRKTRAAKESNAQVVEAGAGAGSVMVDSCPVKLSQCLLCSSKCYPKSKFCGDHKKDAEACRKDAEESGNIAFYNEQSKSAELFRKMLVEYITKCGSKGPGVKRDRFNWVLFQERVFSERHVRKGQKESPMCYEEWMNFAQKKKFKSWQLVCILLSAI